MTNSDLNALGVKEMRKGQLIEVTGGQEPSPWLMFSIVNLEMRKTMAENLVYSLV